MAEGVVMGMGRIDLREFLLNDFAPNCKEREDTTATVRAKPGTHCA